MNMRAPRCSAELEKEKEKESATSNAQLLFSDAVCSENECSLLYTCVQVRRCARFQSTLPEA